MKSEKDIQTAVIHHAKSLGCVSLSLKDRSMPDRCFIKDGKMLFIEFKAPGKKPRKSQLFMFKKLEGKGHKVHVIDDAFEGINLLDGVFK